MASPSGSAASAVTNIGVSASLKRYAFPAAMLVFAIVCQMLVLPQTFPIPHYDVLGVKPDCSDKEIIEAYQRFRSEWDANKDTVVTEHVIAIQHAFELLSDPLKRRDYDLFNVDEFKDVVKLAKEQYIGKLFSTMEIPLLQKVEADIEDGISEQMTEHNFQYFLEDKSTRLILVYSQGSETSKQFAPRWKRVASLLDGVARIGHVELGEAHLALSFADVHQGTRHPFFRYGLPFIVALPSKCRNFDCVIRYPGELNADEIVDWVATSLLGLPRISYYSLESLVKNLLYETASHKIKVIFFSTTGQRAVPFIREVARDYSEYASFGFVLWTEENASHLSSIFGVEDVPSIMFLKDPGTQPFVHYEKTNASHLRGLMEKHKNFDLPQLRSINSLDLGCDARGYSRAGSDVSIWYCVILVGRHSRELSEARRILRKVQDNLSDEVISEFKDTYSVPPSLIAADAFKSKRLTLTWLDGELQKKYCLFYLDPLDSHEACGPKRYLEEEDVPKMFVLRYKRNDSESTNDNKKRFTSVWESILEDDEHLASQLVARYNGSMNVDEINVWISNTIKNGDASNLPNYRVKAPDLIPEKSTSILSQGVALIRKKITIKEKIENTVITISDYSKDPRLGPFFFLLAALYMGQLWLRTKISAKEKKEQRNPKFNRSSNPQESDKTYTSITDVIPQNSYQALETDSDSEVDGE